MNGWEWWSPCEGSEHFEESDEANLETCPPCSEDEESVEGQNDEDDNDDPVDESQGEDHDESVQDGEYEVIPFVSSLNRRTL